MEINQNLNKKILRAQKNEITEYAIYKKLSLIVRKKTDKRVLEKIALEELDHYNFWKRFTLRDVKPYQYKVLFYSFLSKFFGLNFGLMLMERSVGFAQSVYKEFKEIDFGVNKIVEDEKAHEDELVALLDKQGLIYMGSIVLGLNDALVELTGALAGLTLALQNTKIIAIAGLIVGIAASLSIIGSEYLSTKEEGIKNPLKASVFTGLAYALVVFFLILPYFVFKSPFICLAITIAFALLIILIFNFYISVAKNLSFKKRFFEMALISLGIATLNFFIGLLIRKYINIGV